MDTKKVYIHIIDESTNNMIAKILVNHVPRRSDEMRFGGKGNEKYYKVKRVIWVNDEPECPFDRVNIGVSLIL